MESITYQTNLRPASPQIKGGKEYRDERPLWIRIDEILRTSRLESDFISLCMKMTAKFRTKDGRKHCKEVLREIKKNSPNASPSIRKTISIFSKIKATKATSPSVKDSKSPTESKTSSTNSPPPSNKPTKVSLAAANVRNEKKTLSVYDPDI